MTIKFGSIRMRLCAALVASASVFAFMPLDAALAEGELNLYSSRHYDTDERLYSDFEAETGIKINRIEASADELIERIVNEGANSPADVLLTVDAGRLWRADKAGVLAPVDSDALNSRVPESLRHPNNHWFGFSTRARMIFYAKDRVDNPPQTYEALADPAYKGKVCTRSSGNIYMISLMASVIAHAGEDVAKQWATGLYDNRARDPEGNDTAQLRALVSGQCDIVVANSYYFARAIRKEVEGLGEAERANIGWVFPNQGDRGSHVNISGGALIKSAPNKENAIKFLEYLASDQAQEYFSAGNDEFPVVAGVPVSASAKELGDFKRDELNLGALGENQAAAQKVYDEVGYK